MRNGRNRAKSKTGQSIQASRPNLFRPVSWYGHGIRSASAYIEHLLTELGRLGLKLHEIEQHGRAPHTQTVLSDLMRWLEEHPGNAYAKLVDWRSLDFNQIQSRLEKNHSAKPRIELSAQITKMNNLSVRWHPKGWRHTDFDWHRKDHHYVNLITHRKWNEIPDFHWFEGDEDPTFNSRPSNELMYVRGVGNLDPQPRDSHGYYSIFNQDVVHSILICAVRSAYEKLVGQLEHSFEVDVVDEFDFITQDETHGEDELSRRFPISRVSSWSLEDAAELATRRAEHARAQTEKRDREELDNLQALYGFSIEKFVESFSNFSLKKASGPAPSVEGIHRNVAKFLKREGAKFNAGDVRRIFQNIILYKPDLLPEKFRI